MMILKMTNMSLSVICHQVSKSLKVVLTVMYIYMYCIVLHVYAAQYNHLDLFICNVSDCKIICALVKSKPEHKVDLL